MIGSAPLFGLCSCLFTSPGTHVSVLPNTHYSPHTHLYAQKLVCSSPSLLNQTNPPSGCRRLGLFSISPLPLFCQLLTL